jgi:hypothetical protein
MLQADDLFYSQAFTRLGKFANLRWPDAARQLPSLTVLGTEGLIDAPLTMVTPLFALINPGTPVRPPNTVMVAHYHHVDVVAAAPQQNNGKPERVSSSLADFTVAQLGR